MNFQENKPIFQQLADRICDDILLGKYCDHDRIPSVREYAATVEVNANTVMRTYDLLQNLDIIYNRRGIGYFISSDAKKKIYKMKQESFLNDEIEYFFRQLLTLGIDSDKLANLYKEYCNNHKN
jgi:DNA-binding transcriptional regulator YhcF (GntR family)